MPHIYHRFEPEVEAEQFDGGIESYLRIFHWMKACGDTNAMADEVRYTTPEMTIYTAGHRKTLRAGEWVVRSNGLFHVLTDDVFRGTYTSFTPR